MVIEIGLGLGITAIVCTTGLIMYIAWLIYNSKCFRSRCCTDDAVVDIERDTRHEKHIKPPHMPKL